MKIYEYGEDEQMREQLPVTKVEFRENTGEAVIHVNPRVRLYPQLANLPDAFRQQDGLSAEPALSGHSYVLKVRGFSSEGQVLDTIARLKLGTPASHREEGFHATRASAARQNGGALSR